MMGIPENHAKHALYSTGNNSADVAISWYFENQENPSTYSLTINPLIELNTPLRVKKQGGAGNKQGGAPQFSEETVQNLMAMGGFSEKKVKKALTETVIT